ncbi:MAG: hypothetical protein PHO79_09810 [Desulfoplanes sp.]|nr:hypothetical protein [Desulfoplanes sp.]
MRYPGYGWIGLGMVGLCWVLNWTMEGLRTHILFFPLWVGYSLAVDGLVVYRKGTSLLARGKERYVLLFVLSAPSWWFFELINLRTQNWIYLGEGGLPYVGYAFFATLSFCTVMPAVFGTAELMGTFRWVGLTAGKEVQQKPSHALLRGVFVAGWIMFALILVFPRYAYPLVWGAAYCVLDPVNVWRGGRSLLEDAVSGHWKSYLCLGAGCLVCGFFWEMWNYYSVPKWIYDVPFVGFWHIFEMPLLGYLGYIPFSWELAAMYFFLVSFIQPEAKRYLDF